MQTREAAQLGVSGLGSHVAAKRAGAERREANFCRRATAEWQAKKTTVVRETKGGVGARACVLPEMHKCATHVAQVERRVQQLAGRARRFEGFL